MPSRKKNKILTIATLIAITLVSLMLHLWRISYPDRPVFDEAYFAMYAYDYVTRDPYLAIHPPLGNLIYAAALFFAPHDNTANTQFLSIKKASGVFDITIIGKKLAIIDNHLPYRAFPYVSLRIVSAFFGAALPIVLYGFLINIGVSRLGSLIAAGIIVLENALLLQTRLILIDGMYLVFGFAALACYVKKNPRPFAAGIFWGLSLGVKLNAVVFAAPMALWYVMQRKAGYTAASLVKCMITGGLVYLLVISMTNVFFSPQQRFDMWYSLGLVPSRAIPLIPLLASVPSISDYVLTSAIETRFSLHGYITTKNKIYPEYASAWYDWPFMKRHIHYFSDQEAYFSNQESWDHSDIILTGNPIIWWAATLAVGIACSMLLWRLIFRMRHSIGKDHQTKDNKAAQYLQPYKILALLCGGYIFSLLPFFTIIDRSTYLYHYFPSLIFSIGILAMLVSRLLKLDNFDILASWRTRIIALMFMMIILGFLITAPFTYGFLPLWQKTIL